MDTVTRFLMMLALVLLAGSFSLASTEDCRKFDEYANVYCEDQQARLDNFALALEKESNATAYIIVYGGATKDLSGHGPRRWEARARGDGIRDYLANTRGVRTNRIVTIDGGFREKWAIQLYLCPRGSKIPAATPTVPLKDIRFKGKIKGAVYGIFCG